MTSVSISMDAAKMRGALTSLAALGRNPERTLAALGPRLVTNVRARFTAGVDPHGVRWDSYAPLNPLYASGKKGPSILIGAGGMASGLMKSITSQLDGRDLLIGSILKYAPVHQFGATIKAKNAPFLHFSMGGHWFKRLSVHVPARPYLGLSTDDERVIVGELEDALERIITR